MICPQCNTQNRDSAKFCDSCGCKLPEAALTAVPAVVSEEPHQDARVASLADLPQTVDAAEAHDIVDSWFDGSTASDSEAPVPEESTPAPAPVEEDGEPEDEKPSADLSGFIFADSSADASETNVGDSGAFNAFETATIPLSSVWGAGNTAAMPKIEGVPSSEAVQVHAPASKKEERARRKAMKKKEHDARKHLKEAQSANNGNVRRNVLFAILGIVIIGVLIAGATYYAEVWGGKTVPNTQGMSEADAIYTLQSEGFSVRVCNVKSDDTEGLVLLSDPEAGSRVERGSEIVIHVSESRVIPSIVGVSIDKARQLLDEEGFTTGVEYVYTKTTEYDEGTILSVSPEPGTKAKSTSKITVEVAQPYRIPDVTGMTSANATQTLFDAGFTNVYVNEVESTDVPEGTVFASSPNKDEILDPSEFVTIYVAVQRATLLTSAASDYLASAGSVQVGLYTYVIDSIQSVSYSGNGIVSFSISSSAVILPIVGQATIPTQTVTGSITFDENNQIVSIG